MPAGQVFFYLILLYIGSVDRKSILGLHIRSAEGPDTRAGGLPRTQAHPAGYRGDTVPVRLAPGTGRHPGHQARTGRPILVFGPRSC